MISKGQKLLNKLLEKSEVTQINMIQTLLGQLYYYYKFNAQFDIGGYIAIYEQDATTKRKQPWKIIDYEGKEIKLPKKAKYKV